GPNTWLIELRDKPEYRQACAETPGCEPPREVTGPQETIWRALVVREASGGVEIAHIDAVDVPVGDGVPPGRSTGDYLLVGVDDAGNPVDGQLIQFPRTFRIEYAEGTQPPEEIDLEGRRVDTVGYVRADPAVRRLEVRDASGAVAASAEVATRAASRPQPTLPGFASPAWALLPVAALPPACSHVRILNGEADREFAGTLAFTEGTAELKPPGPFQLAAVQAALQRMTPMLCGAVGRIAFAHVAPMESLAVGAVLQAGEGDIVMINDASYPEAELETQADPAAEFTAEWRRLLLQTTVLHESGHSVEALLNATGADPGVYGGEWKLPARSRAERALENTRLREGFGDEWRRLHASFVDVGWARAHSISGFGVPLPDERVVAGGFMTSYGSNIWWDDISEFLSEIYMGPVFRSQSHPSYDLACQAMQAWTEQSVPSRLAAVYAKTLFLENLELVRPADVQACLGADLGLQSTPKGMHMSMGGTKLRSFTRNLGAWIHTEALGNRVFTLRAEGEAGFNGSTYPATLTLRLDLRGHLRDIDEVSWPRGVYPLGLLGDNNFQLVLEGAPAGNFDVTDGFALVAEASNRRITGSVVIQRVMRLQAPLPIPDLYDPPLVVRFKTEK
ncbi:MAG: hypothetical protein R3190_04045, partial [Thermoanaerobaculia bacterium]|nr:hypothetical protein [Thermoanaerobaculia bacterium]